MHSGVSQHLARMGALRSSAALGAGCVVTAPAAAGAVGPGVGLLVEVLRLVAGARSSEGSIAGLASATPAADTSSLCARGSAGGCSGGPTAVPMPPPPPAMTGPALLNACATGTSTRLPSLRQLEPLPQLHPLVPRLGSALGTCGRSTASWRTFASGSGRSGGRGGGSRRSSSDGSGLGGLYAEADVIVGRGRRRRDDDDEGGRWGRGGGSGGGGSGGEGWRSHDRPRRRDNAGGRYGSDGAGAAGAWNERIAGQPSQSSGRDGSAPRSSSRPQRGSSNSGGSSSSGGSNSGGSSSNSGSGSEHAGRSPAGGGAAAGSSRPLNAWQSRRRELQSRQQDLYQQLRQAHSFARLRQLLLTAQAQEPELLDGQSLSWAVKSYVDTVLTQAAPQASGSSRNSSSSSSGSAAAGSSRSNGDGGGGGGAVAPLQGELEAQLAGLLLEAAPRLKPRVLTYTLYNLSRVGPRCALLRQPEGASSSSSSSTSSGSNDAGSGASKVGAAGDGLAVAGGGGGAAAAGVSGALLARVRQLLPVMRQEAVDAAAAADAAAADGLNDLGSSSNSSSTTTAAASSGTGSGSSRGGSSSRDSGRGSRGEDSEGAASVVWEASLLLHALRRLGVADMGLYRDLTAVLAPGLRGAGDGGGGAAAAGGAIGGGRRGAGGSGGELLMGEVLVATVHSLAQVGSWEGSRSCRQPAHWVGRGGGVVNTSPRLKQTNPK